MSLCRNSEYRPCRTSVVPLLPPGTAVPGFHISPLRGWTTALSHQFYPIRVATQTYLALGAAALNLWPVRTRSPRVMHHVSDYLFAIGRNGHWKFDGLGIFLV